MKKALYLAAAAAVAIHTSAFAADTFQVTLPSDSSQPASLNGIPPVIAYGTWNSFQFVDLRGFTGFQFNVQGTSCFTTSHGYDCTTWGQQAVTVQVSLDKGNTWECLGGTNNCVWRALPTQTEYYPALTMTPRAAIPLAQQKNNVLFRIAYDDTKAHPDNEQEVHTSNMTLQLFR